MDNSNHQMAKLHERRLGYGKERKKFERENEFLLIASQNIVMTTNFIKANSHKRSTKLGTAV